MSRMLEIVTPEHVAIRYELAGYGARGVAVLVDTIIMALGVAGLAGICYVVWQLSGGGRDESIEQVLSPAISVVLILGLFVIWNGYHMAFETLWAGETPGKRLMGLRVLRDGGYPVDFRAVVIRNLVRTIDFLPFGYPAAFIAVLANPHYKRLGDMAAGTVVVRHKRERRRLQTFGFGDAQVFRLLDGSTLSALGGISRHEYDMVRRFLDRRRKLPPLLRARFAQQLAGPLMEKLRYPAPALGMDIERWLEEVELGYRYRTIGAPTQQSASSVTIARPVAAAATPAAAPLDGRKW